MILWFSFTLSLSLSGVCCVSMFWQNNMLIGFWFSSIWFLLTEHTQQKAEVEAIRGTNKMNLSVHNVRGCGRERTKEENSQGKHMSDHVLNQKYTRIYRFPFSFRWREKSWLRVINSGIPTSIWLNFIKLPSLMWLIVRCCCLVLCLESLVKSRLTDLIDNFWIFFCAMLLN